MKKEQKGIFQKISRLYLDLKIIWKLSIGFGLTLLMVFLITAVNQSAVFKVNHHLESLIDGELEPLVFLNDIRSYVTELEVVTKDALLDHDQVALNYVRKEYLPNTVRKTVEYSFLQLLNKEIEPKEKQKILEIKNHWDEYFNLYQTGLQTNELFQNSQFKKETNQIRYFLIGGIDRLIETDYRQRAVIAKTEASEIFKEQQMLTGIFLMIAILLALGISTLTAWVIITPLKRLAVASRKIATGELKVVLPENRSDELGQVTQSFNLMGAELLLLVEKIKIAADNVHENSRHLLDGTTITTTATQQLVDTLSQVAVGADTQQNKVALIHDTIQTVTSFSLIVNQIVQRVEQISLESVKQANQGEIVVGQAAEKMKRVQQFMVTSDEEMRQLQSLSGEIGGIALTVKEIGEQINLLALNATIEAARAGESGRGFSVVAESIAELAERTKKATRKVQDLVSRIQKMFSNLLEMMKTENVVIREGQDAMESLRDVFEAIIQATKEVNLELGEVTNYTLKLTEDQNSVLKAVEQITDIALEHKNGTKQASFAAAEHHSFTQEMISTSHILAYWGDHLRQAVDGFNTKQVNSENNKNKKISLTNS